MEEDQRGRTPLLKTNHEKARREWAKMHHDKSQRFWENVPWTDGTKLELFGRTHQLCVEAHGGKNTEAAVKQGGGSDRFRGCFAASGPSGVLDLWKAQWAPRTIRAIWSKMCCPVSESLVSVAGHGSSNRIKTQNTRLKAPKNPSEQNPGLFWRGLPSALV